jgi:hypothetical protein
MAYHLLEHDRQAAQHIARALDAALGAVHAAPLQHAHRRRGVQHLRRSRRDAASFAWWKAPPISPR